MASDNLLAVEQPCSFLAAFSDNWISDYLIQKSLSDADAFSAEMIDPFFAKPEIQTPTASGCSEIETVASKQQHRRGGLRPSGKVTKRKSRASKRATTTFITADPENFRQMVQQVTGVKFSGLNAAVTDPYRSVNRLQQVSGLATLDTSSLYLDSSVSSMVAQPPHPPATGGGSANAPDFNSFCSFPTLESWKVM